MKIISFYVQYTFIHIVFKINASYRAHSQKTCISVKKKSNDDLINVDRMTQLNNIEFQYM